MKYFYDDVECYKKKPQIRGLKLRIAGSMKKI